MQIVFLSSVAKGLEQYREGVYRAIEGLDGYHCVRMEDFGARENTPYSESVALMLKCEIFIGIVGPRHGTLAVETGKSLTESEYDAALASGKRILMFVAEESFPVPANLIEPDELRISR